MSKTTIKLNQAQTEKLKSEGTINIGSFIITYDHITDVVEAIDTSNNQEINVEMYDDTDDYEQLAEDLGYTDKAYL